MNNYGFDVAQEILNNQTWRFQSIQNSNLTEKLFSTHTKFSDIYGNIRSGIKPGRSKIFIIGENDAKHFIAEDRSNADIIKPILSGDSLQRWYQNDPHDYIILTQTGIDIAKYPSIEKYLLLNKESLSKRDEVKKELCKWYELRPCSYYDEFEGSKIVWGDTAKSSRFSWDEKHYLENTAFMLANVSISILGLLQSSVIWYCISQSATPRNIRAGEWRYRVIPQFVERLPIPELSAAQESGLAEQAEAITGLAKDRYQLDEAMRKRLAADLGAGDKLNEKLENWWALDFAGLRAEVKKAFKRDIAVGERDEWERYLADQQAKHLQATQAIIRREQALNAVVYAAFKLTADEIGLIEQATKYPYGAV